MNINNTTNNINIQTNPGQTSMHFAPHSSGGKPSMARENAAQIQHAAQEYSRIVMSSQARSRRTSARRHPDASLAAPTNMTSSVNMNFATPNSIQHINSKINISASHRDSQKGGKMFSARKQNDQLSPNQHQHQQQYYRSQRQPVAAFTSAQSLMTSN